MNRKENGVKKYDLINGAAAREEAQRLLMPDELVTMNLFELIFSFPEASAWTDHESFIIGQSNEKLRYGCGFRSAAGAKARNVPRISSPRALNSPRVFI